MKYLQNLHTHSTFCDGKYSLEEMVKGAIDKGFHSLGFSGHGYTSWWSEYCMTEEGTKQYKEEIKRLKEVYKDQIDLYCGLEMDLYCDGDLSGFDYILGSVHAFQVNGHRVDFDQNADKVRKIINEEFGGDGMKYAKRYYETVAELAQCKNVDFVGHFDIITKHYDRENFFDVESAEYKRYALEALDAVSSKIQLFEINSGAIARGYRKTSYPDDFILKGMKERGCGIVITSDCHDYHGLDCHFDEMAERMRAAGFKERYILTKSGFEAIGLDD